MLLDVLLSGDIQSFLVSFLLSLPIVLLSLSLHETAHGYVAYKLGDPTARSLGRLTLNPIKHLDPIGFLCMLFFGFGWAKPVPVNSRYFKKPKRDMALTGVAGPISNLLLALLFAVLLRVEIEVASHLTLTSEFAYLCVFWLQQFLIIGVQLNVTLAVFNLLPVPPLDGSRLFLSLLPADLYFKIMRYEQYISLALMAALAFGLLDAPIEWLSNFVLDLIFMITF